MTQEKPSYSIEQIICLLEVQRDYSTQSLILDSKNYEAYIQRLSVDLISLILTNLICDS